MNILLVEPDFPIPPVSRNHRDFLPIGLLKLASYHRSKDDAIQLVRGNQQLQDFNPDLIKITSLFTYWSKFVWDSVAYYKEVYPRAKVVVGGIYATLMPEHCMQSGCDEVFIGVDQNVENFKPAYDLVDVNYQIVHASRGCDRKCEYCGTWKLEPEFTWKESILDEICSNRIIFYDNNMLANPYIETILDELTDARHNGRIITLESQCGIDGRLLTLKLARMLKKARFTNPRIAWDHGLKDFKKVKEQIDMLVEAGYGPRSIYVFMLFNFEIECSEMLKKIEYCKKWGVQVADCRYRPLDQTYDNYNPYRKQTEDDYYIHPKWTDEKVRTFRRAVREQNITIRYRFGYYSRELELQAAKVRTKRNRLQASKP
ncbi:MAG: cobalamin B12-binding domain-containing protein [Calditrichaeota bacterium]|nr:cobalamin B12-binding domain-containing protein [Calditrichota bacterium]